MYAALQKYLMSLSNLLPRLHFIFVLQDNEILQPINTKFSYNFYISGVCVVGGVRVSSDSTVCKPPSLFLTQPTPSILLFMERELIFLKFLKRKFCITIIRSKELLNIYRK